jgi:hypothetical protein
MQQTNPSSHTDQEAIRAKFDSVIAPLRVS